MPLFSKKNYSTVKVRKRDIPDGLWLKCPGCQEIIFKQELDENASICPKCGHHFQMSRADRIKLLLEEGSFEEWNADMYSVDILGFTGTASYTSKLEENRRKTGHSDAISIGRGLMGPHSVGFGVMDFSFLGASMGSVVGEKVTLLIEKSTALRLPVVLVCASGGARMYEGMFSLMQMAKTSGALARHAEAGLPYIPVLTHPTTAGVMASFATLGDLIIAEPSALIGFAGPRVIKETTQQDLPEGFQRSEFLLKKGLLDMVVNRKQLKQTLVLTLDYLQNKPAAIRQNV
ncbi:MAG: acetyl-CoA carboxylase carboxyltransferase subunit beta [Kiritimatiellae bacterium]|nr:acetyl-CoA carboxylase carboxyltransferase subunit beta [Kiritimatiellia bacterium]MCO5044479.1 acetyl-CoA carboxylase, carboxyltransferase subunit beta [Kiritimatiellia bacterium]MCO5062084.1 acetyl-CoA carboxylase, carboxyltransferase subunit beta [Kiritimatiellia bacterium]MCO5067451.1 acetyl-CoA carboxylase, carboxyltransferase subunit beta [Kiritimatiellia bacterium]MCO6399776.1 acetyl-CoA carboxylase carboxyltransferase subunit beta [Verrucomicrobiota bacterium]